MTGIYGGCLVMLAWLMLRRRVLYYGTPSRAVIAVLALGVATMAADGTNSLLTDLRLWHPWESTNETRFLTGYATGSALAVGLSWLLASSVWRMSSADVGVRGIKDIMTPLAAAVPLLVAVTSGWSLLAVPGTWLLMLSSWLTVSLLTMVALLLALRIEDRIVSIRQLHVPGTVAAGLALTGMILLATGRFWLEREMGFAVPV